MASAQRPSSGKLPHGLYAALGACLLIALISAGIYFFGGY